MSDENGTPQEQETPTETESTEETEETEQQQIGGNPRNPPPTD